MQKTAAGLRAAFVVATAGMVSAWGCALLPGFGLPGPEVASKKSGPASRAEQIQSVRESIQSLQDSVKGASQQYANQMTNTGKAAAAFSGSGSASGGSASKFRVQGRFQYGNGGTLEWDDTTKQLTRAYDGATDVQLSFSGKDQEDRSFTATLLKSPDGTTGFIRGFLGSGGWSRAYFGMPSAPVPAAPYSGYYPSPTPTPPPFEVFYNEYPDIYSMTKAEVSVGVTPQGISAKAYEFTVGADEFKLASFKLRQRLANLAPRPSGCFSSYDGQGRPTTVCSSPAPAMPLPPFNAPGRIYVRAKVEKVRWDESIRWRENGTDGFDILLTGSITLKTNDAGEQTWNNDIAYVFSPQFENVRVDFTLENPDKQVKIKGVGKPKKDARGWLGTEITGDVLSTQNDEKIGTLSFDSTKGDKYPIIEFADGSPRKEITFEGAPMPAFPSLPGPTVPAVPTSTPGPAPTYGGDKYPSPSPTP